MIHYNRSCPITFVKQLRSVWMEFCKIDLMSFKKSELEMIQTFAPEVHQLVGWKVLRITSKEICSKLLQLYEKNHSIRYNIEFLFQDINFCKIKATLTMCKLHYLSYFCKLSEIVCSIKKNSMFEIKVLCCCEPIVVFYVNSKADF